MTLIVCAKGTDGMVLASDSRGTFGDPRGMTAQNDTMKKCFKLNKYSALLISGAAELGETIVQEILKDVRKQKIKAITKTMEITRKLLKEKYDDWFQKFPPVSAPNVPVPTRPNLGVIVAGYENIRNDKLNVPKIYSLLSPLDFPPSLHSYGFALNGVPQYALYLLNRLYSKNMKVQNLKQLLAYVITETATQDGKVGGPVQMIIINKDGCKELSQGEIKDILVKNQSNSKRLKKLFFGE